MRLLPNYVFQKHFISINKWLAQYKCTVYPMLNSAWKNPKIVDLINWGIKPLRCMSLSTEYQIWFVEGLYISCYESRLWFHIKTKGCKMSVSKHPACMKYLYITLWALRNVVWLAFTSLFCIHFFCLRDFIWPRLNLIKMDQRFR